MIQKTNGRNGTSGRNVTIFAGDLPGGHFLRSGNKPEEKQGIFGRKESINEQVEAKRAETKKKVNKVMKDQFERDMERTNAINGAYGTIEEMKTMMQEANAEMQKLTPEQEGMRAIYAAEIAEGIAGIKEANGVIGSNLEASLKQHGMADALEVKGELEKAGSGEIVGMLQDEAMKHIKEELDKVVEAAKEKAEEKEEQEEKAEEKKAEEAEAEARIAAQAANAAEQTAQAGAIAEAANQQTVETGAAPQPAVPNQATIEATTQATVPNQATSEATNEAANQNDLKKAFDQITVKEDHAEEMQAKLEKILAEAELLAEDKKGILVDQQL